MAAKCLSKFSWVKVLALATFSSFSSLVKSEIMLAFGVVDPWDSMMKLMMSSLLIRSSLSQMAANADAEWSLHGLVVDDEDDGRRKRLFWCQNEAFFLKSFPLVGKSFQPRPDFLPFPFNSSKARNEMIEFGEIALLASRRAQCGKFKIFLSLRFYVKSILEKLEVLKLQFLPFLGLWILSIW